MIYNATHINVDCIICNNSSIYNFSKIFITKNTSSHVVFFHIQGQLLYTAKFEPYMLTTSYYTVYICSTNDILAYMGHNVITVWYKMSNCFHICNKLLEQSAPYVVLNGYVPGCTSYNTNMYHIMIGICHNPVQKITFGCVVRITLCVCTDYTCVYAFMPIRRLVHAYYPTFNRPLLYVRACDIQIHLHTHIHSHVDKCKLSIRPL